MADWRILAISLQMMVLSKCISNVGHKGEKLQVLDGYSKVYYRVRCRVPFGCIAHLQLGIKGTDCNHCMGFFSSIRKAFIIFYLFVGRCSLLPQATFCFIRKLIQFEELLNLYWNWFSLFHGDLSFNNWSWLTQK